MKHRKRNIRGKCDSFTGLSFEGSMLCPKILEGDLLTYRGCKICGYDRHPKKFGGQKKTYFNRQNLDASIVQVRFENDPEY